MTLAEPRPFDVLEESFRLLASPPSPMTVNGAVLGLGLPRRPVPLDELKRLLLDRHTPAFTRDGVLGYLVLRSNRHGGRWTVALAGMLLPGLRKGVEAFWRASPASGRDFEAEMLAGLLVAIRRCPPDGVHIASRLIWSAQERVRRLFRIEAVDAGRTVATPDSAAPPRPWDHPDFLLAEAMRVGVISRREAALIGETRLGNIPLRDLADAWDVPYDTLQKQRRRAEQRLVPWLLGDPLTSLRP